MPNMTTYQRAVQIYQVLICAAHHRQTVTYEMVGNLVGLPQVGLAPHLEHLLLYCDAMQLPHFTVLVVRKHEGTPSSGFHADVDVDRERQRVFAFEWFRRPPLTEDELRRISHPS